jgi:ATP-dependent RNA helicase SUPV3L1/SUV3
MLRALLGPTNTGKTWVALEELCDVVDGGGAGVIGFPLRLLAREAYDKLVLRLGAHKVALVTGEEKIVPPFAQAYACTVETMPEAQPSGAPFQFVAVDEIQLCADRERGHVFTERLLHRRGTETTLVLGQDTIAPVLVALFGDRVKITTRPRLSTLRHVGRKKLSRLPKRSAVVCFSVKDVYALAEEVRHHHGGAAVVTGSLSPATRNAQVALFQNGDVDVLVATDAIGMGLNLDIDHVAFAALTKFDGEDVRRLSESEVGQIAGRAGRHVKNGTFGVCTSQALHDVDDLDKDAVFRIEHHQFARLTQLSWRNAQLDYSSLASLHASLRAPPAVVGADVGVDVVDARAAGDVFGFGRPASDLLALERLMHKDDVRARVRRPADVQLLFEACQIPDFEKIGPAEHTAIVHEVWHMLAERGTVDDDWLDRAFARVNDPAGDVETLVARLGRVRTLAYLTHKSGWVRDPARRQHEARSVEDALSDALHEGLQLRFVDRLARVVVGGNVRADVDVDGAVTVGGEAIGTLSGLRFVSSRVSAERRDLHNAAAQRGLEAVLAERITALEDADASAFDVDAATLQVVWGSEPVGRLVRGQKKLWPRAVALPGAFDAAVRVRLDEKLTTVARAVVERHLKSVVALDRAVVDDDRFAISARAYAHAVVGGLGIADRAAIEDEGVVVDDAGRKTLRRFRVRLGFRDVFVDDAFKDRALRLRAGLAALWARPDDAPPPLPPSGASSFLVGERPLGFVRACGFHVVTFRERGADGVVAASDSVRAVRVDLVDDVAAILKTTPAPFSLPASVCEKLGCSVACATAVVELLGYRADAEGRFRRGRR